jgi:L-2-hydroxyglutarate oxidase LhgO
VQHHVNHERVGKLIVAPVDGGLDRLREIKTQAEKNGVSDLQFLTAEEVHELEPDVVCGSGVLSPSTGIIDSHGLMLAFVADIEASGGSVVCSSEVTDLQVGEQGVSFQSGGELFVCKTLVNSAGLRAQDLVSRIKAFPQQKIPKSYFAKAHYFSYPGKPPFKHLVYPLPAGGGLGIHATNDLSGAVRFGPDITWIDGIDYSFDERRKSAFVKAIKTYFPDLDEERLAPAYTGIRPKLGGPGAQFTDFNIQFEADHGVPGLVNLYGIESPGLTACLAIGDFIKHNL